VRSCVLFLRFVLRSQLTVGRGVGSPGQVSLPILGHFSVRGLVYLLLLLVEG
jgi:hypothetical protein